MNLTLEQFVDEKEESKLFKAMEPFVKAGDKRAIVERMLYQLLALSGLRISEALALTWDHVGSDYLMVYSDDSKSGDARSVIISRKLIKLLAEFKLHNPYKDSKFLFNTQKGQYKRSNAHDRLKYWLKVAGLRDSISCHSFRHTYATRLLNQGISLPMVRDQLGHYNIAITSVYLHFTMAAREKLAEVI